MKSKRGRTVPCGAPHTADMGLIVLYPHILWSVGETVHDPCCEVVVHPCVFQFVLQKNGQYGIEGTDRVKKVILSVLSAFSTLERDLWEITALSIPIKSQQANSSRSTDKIRLYKSPAGEIQVL